MGGLVNGDMAAFVQQGSATALIAVGITTGIVVASEIVNFLLEIARRRGKRQQVRP